MKRFFTQICLLALTIFATIFLGLSAVNAQSTAYADAGLAAPTVTSDKDDYAPGEIAHITGTGWTLDQGVHVEFKETPDYPDYHIYDINVDANGNWKIDYQIEGRHVGVAFTVTALGKQSGGIATAVFTDANSKITVTDATGESGGTITLTATLQQAGNSGPAGSNGPLAGRTINFYLNSTFVGSAITNSAGVATLTTTVPSTIAPGTYNKGITATFAGDAANNPYSGSTGEGKLTVTPSTCTAPVITQPANQSANTTSGSCSATVNYSISSTGTTPITYTYTTSGATTTASTTGTGSGTTFNKGVTTVTVTATNRCGSNTKSFTVTVNDNQNPTISCPANITQNNAQGTCGAPVTFAATASDNCPGVTVTYSQNPGTTFPVGTTTVTATATDATGNKATCTFDVKVVDNENPAITCPAPVTVNNDTRICGAKVTFAATATDNCPGTKVTYSQNPGTTFPVGKTTVTATATDAAGNASTCTFDVTVVDKEKPSITCPAPITQNNDAGVCGAKVTFAATATDNCPGTKVTYSQNPGTTFAVGKTTVTATATDAAGNTSTCTFDVTVVDNEKPVIDCPADITVNNDAGVCGAKVTFAATATDNCPGTKVTYSQNPGTTFPIGTTTVTATATDAAGNASTCEFTVTVVDNEKPVIDCPADITVNNDAGVCGAKVSFEATATDNCPGTKVTYSQNPGTTFPIGTTTVTATATDAAGNASTCSFDVTVVDNEKPVIDCPADITVNNDAGVCGAKVSFEATATDNCPGTKMTYSQNPGTTFPIGTTTVTATATDAAGNASTCSFDVTVVDNEKPVIDCPADITVNNDAGVCGAKVTFAATATDNCPGTKVTYSQNPGTTFPIGTTTVRATATDASGNTSTCSFDVTVVDNEKPVIDCPADITVNNDAGICGAKVSFEATATDNCPGTKVTYSQNPGTTFPIGTTTVTATATDAAGSTSTCSFDVTVVDKEKPSITCPAPITQNNDAGVCGAKVTFAATATDNCPGTKMTYSQNPGTTFPVGKTTVTATATDAAGNTSTCTFDVTVVDKENPSITCPSNITLSACQSTATYSTPTASDNCSGVTVARTAGPASGSTFANGTTTTVTYTATDASGNKTSCSFTVTRASTLMAKCGNTNPQLYFGYTGDQSSTISGTPTGGTGPYTVTITMNRPLKCNYINSTGDEIFTPGAGGTATNNTCPTTGTNTVAPVSYKTNVTSGSSYSVNVTLLANAVFTITVTDAKGCTSTCTTTVSAEDVRCFAGNSSNQKYTMCHRTGSSTNPCVTICVDKSAVNTHLAHGDVLGSCPKTGCPAPATTTASKSIRVTTSLADETGADKLTVKVMPNPSITHFNLLITSNKKDMVNMKIMDMAGRIIEEKLNVTPNGTTQLGAKYFPGMYIAEVIQGKERVTVKLIKTYR